MWPKHSASLCKKVSKQNSVTIKFSIWTTSLKWRDGFDGRKISFYTVSRRSLLSRRVFAAGFSLTEATGSVVQFLVVRPICQMKHLLNHLIQRHLIPLLLLPVVLSGFSCFAIYGLLHELRNSSATDLIILAIISSLGIIGTFCTLGFLRVVRSQPATWQVFELGRTAWSVLITVAWIAGVACGVLMIYETSR